tara:strand:+ start:307 stop:585 length:279 start_codon:yes stop_codon:yes gene_type:complete
MIFYKVKPLALPQTAKAFETSIDAIRAAMSYDHEYVVLMSDTQDPLGQDVQFAYVCGNEITLDDMATADFIAAAKKVALEWPYKITNSSAAL